MKYKALYSRDTGKKIAECKDGEWTYFDYEPPAQTHMVMGDIQPYKSMVDGSEISSRSQHRSHLRQHGMIEVGNEIKALTKNSGPMKPPPGLKETLIRVANEKLR